MENFIKKTILISSIAVNFFAAIHAMNGVTNMMPSYEHGGRRKSMRMLGAVAHMQESQADSEESDDSSKNLFKCKYPGCGRKYKTKYILKEHAETHVSKYKCPKCGTIYSLKKDCVKHIKDKHSSSASPIEIDAASAPTKKLVARKDLVRTKARTYNFQCTFQDCAKKYASLNPLVGHLAGKKHLNKKPFACRNNSCASKFSDHNKRREHERDKHDRVIDSSKPENQDYQDILDFIDQHKKDGNEALEDNDGDPTVATADAMQDDAPELPGTAQNSSNSNSSSEMLTVIPPLPQVELPLPENVQSNSALNSNSDGIVPMEPSPQGRGKSMDMLAAAPQIDAQQGDVPAEFFPAFLNEIPIEPPVLTIPNLQAPALSQIIDQASNGILEGEFMAPPANPFEQTDTLELSSMLGSESLQLNGLFPGFAPVVQEQNLGIEYDGSLEADHFRDLQAADPQEENVLADQICPQKRPLQEDDEDGEEANRPAKRQRRK